MKSKLKLISLVFAFVILPSGCLSGFSKEHPKDAELLENFQTHKAGFNQLLQMFFADKGLGRVAYDFTRPEDLRTVGVSSERLSEYKKLFRKLDLSAGIEGYNEKDYIWFHASTQGLSVTGSGKGYAYLKERPPLVVDDLDTYWSKDGRSFTAFRHIEDNWYLYFDYED